MKCVLYVARYVQYIHVCVCVCVCQCVCCWGLRYHHSLSLLLPGLEHALRRVFACVNHCPHRVITAEVSSYIIEHHVYIDPYVVFTYISTLISINTYMF